VVAEAVVAAAEEEEEEEPEVRPGPISHLRYTARQMPLAPASPRLRLQLLQ